MTFDFYCRKAVFAEIVEILYIKSYHSGWKFCAAGQECFRILAHNRYDPKSEYSKFGINHHRKSKQGATFLRSRYGSASTRDSNSDIIRD